MGTKALEKRTRNAQTKKLWKWIREYNSGMCWCGSGLAPETVETTTQGFMIGCEACTPELKPRTVYGDAKPWAPYRRP